MKPEQSITPTQTKTAPAVRPAPRSAGHDLAGICASLGLGKGLSVEEAAQMLREYLWAQRRVVAYLSEALTAYEQERAQSPSVLVLPLACRTERSEGGRVQRETSGRGI